ncbi:hypothetical protein [Actinoplanes sp. NPDC023714]|uniref:hypothetical protein n=1 Tax=Actinoplanes sp. NPDC023714 TaxID=3154322 RepID=UPI0033E6CB62
MGRVAGRVHTGRVAARVPPLENARTDIAPLGELPPPVFADPGGTRHRRLRRLSYTVAITLFVLLLAFWFSQLGDGILG